MLRIGICDDQAQARLLLRSALERILDEQNVQAQCFEFSSGETLLQWYDRHTGELDLLFLDMELHVLDGMETACRLQRNPNDPLLRILSGSQPKSNQSFHPWLRQWPGLVYGPSQKTAQKQKFLGCFAGRTESGHQSSFREHSQRANTRLA